MTTRISLFLLFPFLLGLVPALTQEYTPQSVPNLRLSTGSYVSDPAGILSQDTVQAIDKELKKLEDSLSVEISVVVLPSIGEAVPRDFAHDLFNLWGIGKKGVDNGLLLLVVRDQRRVEIETGLGIEAILPDALCKRIITKHLAPAFKRNAYGEGVLAGIQAITAIVSNPDTAAEVIKTESDEGNSWGWQLKGYLILTILLNGLILYFLRLTLRKKATAYQLYQALEKYNLVPLVFFFPFPLLGIIFWVRRKMKVLRDTPPEAPPGLRFVRAPASNVLVALNTGQAKELELGVAEYDVWTAANTPSVVLRYKKTGKGYSNCPACQFQTEKCTGTTLLRAATYSQSGEERLDYTCLHCGNHHEKIRVIPKKDRSTGSGGSRSASSGRSWGGGRSGGGGAGGGW